MGFQEQKYSYDYFVIAKAKFYYNEANCHRYEYCVSLFATRFQFLHAEWKENLCCQTFNDVLLSFEIFYFTTPRIVFPGHLLR